MNICEKEHKLLIEKSNAVRSIIKTVLANNKQKRTQVSKRETDREYKRVGKIENRELIKQKRRTKTSTKTGTTKQNSRQTSTNFDKIRQN